MMPPDEAPELEAADAPETPAPEPKEEAKAPEPTSIGEVAYNAYFFAVGGRSYDGHALQSWEGLNHQPLIRNAWEAAAHAVLAYADKMVDFSNQKPQQEG